MVRGLSLLVLVCALVVATSAREVTWNGGAGNSLWSFATNWDGNAVPTKDDDVVLNPVGGSAVTISQPAVAKSISIGGGSFHQALTVQSSLAVGDGGITVRVQGVLIISSNNDLPLTTVGDALILAGGTFQFTSGEIKGPGTYTVDYGGYLEFSGSALKLIEAADVVVHGTATIQPTTIQLAKGSTVTNGGDTTAVGSITIFSNDNSQASFYSYGNFSYTGQSASAPLTFQVATYFAADLDITAGAVILQGFFHSAATITLPSGTTLTVQSGPELKTFQSITGAGSVNVNGIAEVDGTLAVSWTTIADSGSLTLNNTSSTKSLSVAGKLVLSKGVTFSATDVSVVAGTITGEGQLSASGNFEVAVSSNGNSNSFLSAKVNVAGTGFLTGSVTLLFADAGYLNIQKGATFGVTSSASFVKQTGTPIVNNNGNFTVRLAVGSTFKTSVDFTGAGAFSATAGEIIFDGASLNATVINLGNNAILRSQNAAVTVGAVGGGGALNISGIPTANSTYGDVALAYLGVVGGHHSARSLKLTTLEIFNGDLTLNQGSANTAVAFNFYGGTLRGVGAKLGVSSAFTVGGNIPQTLDAVVVSAGRFVLRAGTPQGTFITLDNAQVSAGSTW